MQVNALPDFFDELNKALPNCDNEIRRIFHGRGRLWQGLDQLTADWLGTQLIVNLFKPVDDEFMQSLVQGLQHLSQTEQWKHIGAQGIGLQHRYEHGAPFEVITGNIELKPVAIENGLKYQLELGKNQNSGLFLDMRLGREWLQQRAQDKAVLNLFSYTCGFSVAAIEGGASKVVNVDMARASLTRGRDNHRLNQHDLSKVTFMGHDIFRSWGKITKAGPYDVIVIDPPSFQKGSFALTKDYKRILRRLPSLLTPQGIVLACVNSPAVTQDFLIDTMLEEAPELIYQQRLANPLEFADIDEQASLKALVFSR
ncbi:methyltransferase domain-containing protein [Vibrio sp. S11_S32]|uniref:class I SAM-dependent methyltransferase n=1 Tax=Vibrio sp. S11_S32 TaxID=2720225 RepID=UPI001681388E|nr:class I SAM-dependent methyltransferase [Vibrio sp. S11_S32]MBD1577075.1 methyltransferase domain-containing protein [Vibrio sp. S11_S32]